MTDKPDNGLLPIAHSIADGDDVEWDRQTATDPDARARLERLRRLADVLKAVRTVSTHDDSPGGADASDRVSFRWGPLDVYERIGEGSFGEVYRAVEPRLSREVALKLRRADHPDATSRELLDEARRLARVRHPNVVVVHGADIHDGRVGLWTEFVRGTSLDERLSEQGPCSAEELIRLGVDLSRALAAVHAASLLHGDVKGANVLQAADGRTLLADFGSGSDAISPESFSFSGGSPLCMAPELLEGEQSSAATDIYSLGVLLYRQATGRYPVFAESFAELAAAHRSGERTPMSVARPDLPVALTRVIENMLDPSPASRPSTAPDVESALLGAAHDLSASSSTRSTPNHNLPNPVTSFVGRAQEQRRITELIETAPVVTIHGAGGTGKTRLALEFGRKSLMRYADGVWIVDLASVATGSLVPQTVAATLNLPTGSDATSRVTDYLSYRSTLLILDNCEHVIDGCTRFVNAAAPGCPGLRILATSRELLHVESEVSCLIAPLAIPGDDAHDVTEVAGIESVELFLDRARTVSPKLAVDETTAASVAEICKRLDGIPLAIELAAALLVSMSLEEVREAFEGGRGLLTTGSRAARPRHRTLEALIDWSFELLDPTAQILLRRLSVFAGGWTLEAAERICAGDGTEPADVLPLLDELRTKSLVEIHPGRRAAKRYRILEPIREYLTERLVGAERDRVVQRHRDHYLSYAERTGPRLDGAGAVELLSRLEMENGNLRVAFDACEAASDPELGLRMAVALGRFWEIKGYWDEGLERIENAVARLGAEHRSAAFARVLTIAGNLARFSGKVKHARTFYEKSAAIARALGDAGLEAGASNGLGIVADKEGEPARAEKHLEHALALTEGHRDRARRCPFLITLALIRYRLGRLDSAAELLLESIAIARESHQSYQLALGLDNYGALGVKLGRNDEAEAAYREALELMQQLGDPRGLATCSNNLGILLYNLGQHEEATALMLESLRLKYHMGNRLGIAYSLESLVSLAAETGAHERLVELAAAADALRRAIGEPNLDPEGIDRPLAHARRQLDEDTYASCWKRGESLPLREVVELARRTLSDA